MMFLIQGVIQFSETCFVGLDLKVEPWQNSDDTANASERQLDGEVLDGEWVSDWPAGNLTRSVGSRNIDIKPHLERICR